MDEVKTVRRDAIDSPGVRLIFRGGPEDGLVKESKRVIRAILSVVEEYTNYNELDAVKRKMVRSTILDNVNNMKRVSLLYIDSADTSNDT